MIASIDVSEQSASELSTYVHYIVAAGETTGEITGWTSRRKTASEICNFTAAKNNAVVETNKEFPASDHLFTTFSLFKSAPDRNQ
jgi:hypothetical protein